ncbi:MAG: hypothetical protein JWO80_3466, partial [Bryobacterales bacterium]|nr:hypothetical protein [Bryobacterales bacterium]
AERADVERLIALGQLETLRAELRNLQTERLVLTSECRRLASGSQAVEAQMDDARDFLRREQTLRIELERSAADLRAEVAQLKWASRQQAGLREELREERCRRKDLENSYCWRATAPVRSALKFLNFRGAGARPQQ